MKAPFKRNRWDQQADTGPLRKTLELTISVTPGINLTAAAVLVNGVAQGTADGQRIGRTVRWKRLRGVFQISANTAASFVIDRSVIFWKNQVNGGVLADQFFVGGNSWGPISITFRDAYTLLYSKFTSMGIVGTTVLSASGENQNVIIEIDIDLTGLTTVYSGNGATVASIASGALYMWNNASSNTGNFQGTLEYEDV